MILAKKKSWHTIRPGAGGLKGKREVGYFKHQYNTTHQH
jgi:hypothetical protein